MTNSGVLNDTSELVRQVAAPWSAVLALTSLPFRFLQANFIDRVAELGSRATHYGNALRNLALMTMIAFVVAMLGRAIYTRACRLAAEGDEHVTTREVFRLPAASTLSFLAVSMLLQGIGTLFSFTIILLPLVTILLAVAAATYERVERPSLFAPFKVIARYSREGRIHVALTLIFTLAFILASVDLHVAFSFFLWMAQAIAGADLSRIIPIFTLSTRLYSLLLGAGAIVLLEPFWLAAHVSIVRRSDARQSGEDLRGWLRDLRAAEEEEELSA